MIEQAIYFALGCIVTALCALGFLPILWNRALRLTRRRLQLQIPVSMQEILAERDQIRAQFAVERLRIEQEMDRVRASKTADMAEIGRQSMLTHALSEKCEAMAATELDRKETIERLERENVETSAEAGVLRKGINDAHAVLDQRSNELLQLVAERDVNSAAFEANDHAWMAREETLRGRLDAAMAQAMRHETSSLSLRRESDDLKSRVRFLEQELTRVNNALEIERREDAPQAQAVSTVKLDVLEAENASLRQALASLTPAIDGIQHRSHRDEKADAELRSSIHTLGLAVAVMAREARDLSQKGPRAARGSPQPAVRVDAE